METAGLEPMPQLPNRIKHDAVMLIRGGQRILPSDIRREREGDRRLRVERKRSGIAVVVTRQQITERGLPLLA